MSRIKTWVVCALLAVVWVLAVREKRLVEERDRYRANTDALLCTTKRIQVDSTTMALETKALKLTLDEYREYRATDLKKIESMGVRIKSLQAIARHELDVEASVSTRLKDSIVTRDTVHSPVKVIRVDEEFLKIDGMIENDRLVGTIRMEVALNQVIWVEYKHRFLWWRWKVKAVHQTISSDNPHVQLRYSEFINIEK